MVASLSPPGYHAPVTELATPPRVIDPAAPVYNARLVRREDMTESLAYFWVKFDGEPTPSIAEAEDVQAIRGLK